MVILNYVIYKRTKGTFLGCDPATKTQRWTFTDREQANAEGATAITFVDKTDLNRYLKENMVTDFPEEYEFREVHPVNRSEGRATKTDCANGGIPW